MASLFVQVCSTITDPHIIWNDDVPQCEIFYKLLREGPYRNFWIRAVVRYQAARGHEGSSRGDLRTAHLMATLPVRQGRGPKWLAPTLLSA